MVVSSSTFGVTGHRMSCVVIMSRLQQYIADDIIQYDKNKFMDILFKLHQNF